MQPYHCPSLELRHMVALQAIAEKGSFWAAADYLDCSASALSQQIGSLERTVGHRLIERSPGRRHVSLTEPGQLLLRHADVIVSRLQAAHADLEAYGSGDAGSLRIGTYQSVGTRVLPQLLRNFATNWPRINLRMSEEGDDNLLLDMIERGELDLTFSVQPLPSGPFASAELMLDPYVLMVPIGSHLGVSAPVQPADLAEQPLIGYQTFRSQEHIDVFLRSQGIHPMFVFRSNDNSIVQSLVGAGIGAALVPALSVSENDQSVRLLPLRDVAPRILILVWHADRYRSPAAIAFTGSAQKLCEGLEARGRNLGYI
jgi:DNA-binding transcriptional LysR family regulator